MTGSPVIWFQSVNVESSNISLFERNNNPEDPNL